MFKRFVSDTSGQSAVEYALIISVVGLVAALGTMALHDTTMTSLQAMTEPDKGSTGQLSEAVVQSPTVVPTNKPPGDSFTDKLANYKKDKEKGNQGLALGHIIGHGTDKKQDDLNKKEAPKKDVVEKESGNDLGLKTDQPKLQEKEKKDEAEDSPKEERKDVKLEWTPQEAKSKKKEK